MARKRTIRTGSRALLVYPAGDCDEVTVVALDHSCAHVRLPRQPGASPRVVAVELEDIGLGVVDDLAFVLDDGCTTFVHGGAR